MIDFSALPRKNKTYAGANGSKISVVYNGEQYMLKFPPVPRKNTDMSYTNSCISEYIGSHIFNILGIRTQETLLGKFTVNNKEKIVVACKDFTSLGITLQDFASLKNQMIDSAHNGYGTELTDIIYTIENQQAIDPNVLTEHFWNLFIADAFIGNFDRHNGNWGFLYNEQTDEMSIAPIYDCGSCLYPQASEETISAILSSKEEIDARVFVFPTSAIQNEGKKINYFDFISSFQNNDCNNALKRIAPKIDMTAIEKMINEISCISELQKQFYITMLRKRKTHIIDYSFNELKKKEQNTN